MLCYNIMFMHILLRSILFFRLVLYCLHYRCMFCHVECSLFLAQINCIFTCVVDCLFQRWQNNCTLLYCWIYVTLIQNINIFTLWNLLWTNYNVKGCQFYCKHTFNNNHHLKYTGVVILFSCLSTHTKP